ncbi:MAG: hypothetical protein IK016_11305 [Lachnospiraceae bacterium]|nr:hypothetical protein [Lachnospiraceae bacterium]
MTAYEKYNLRKCLFYAAVTLFCFTGGLVYEYFGFGVTSSYMHLAFLIPFAGGCLPCLSAAATGCALPVKAYAAPLWRAGLATLTIGSLLRGALDIYGTDSPLLYAYLPAGLLCLSAALYLSRR